MSSDEHYAARVDALKADAVDLRPGDIIVSPALRTEQISTVERGRFRIAVTTKAGSKTYVWHLDHWTKVPTLRIPARIGEAKVFMRTEGNKQILAFVSIDPGEAFHHHLLAGAGFEGRGEGWTVTDAAFVAVEPVEFDLDKRAAAARVRALAKAHARRLGLSFEEVRG